MLSVQKCNQGFVLPLFSQMSALWVCHWLYFSLQVHRVDPLVRDAIIRGAIIKRPALHTSMKVFLDLTDLSRAPRRLTMEPALNIRRRSATFAVDQATTLRRRNRPYKLSQRTLSEMSCKWFCTQQVYSLKL